MLALAFKNDPAPLVKKLREAGLLVVGAGGHAIRFLPHSMSAMMKLNRQSV